jgi:hypothetical protein
MVYAHALGRQKFVVHLRIRRPPPSDKSCKVLSPIALLFVNKQVHQEAFHVLYEEIEYQVWLHQWHFEHRIWHLPWNFAKITKLSIRIQLCGYTCNSWVLWYKEIEKVNWSVLRQMSNLRSLRLEILTTNEKLIRNVIDEFKREHIIEPVLQIMRNFVDSIPKSVTTLKFGEEDDGEETDCEDTYPWKSDYFRAWYRLVSWGIRGKYMLRVYEEIKKLQSADADL